MCGFFGCFHNRNFSIDKDFFIKISGSIKHRGPDASGYKEFILKDKIIKFSHHRLSIIDLRDVAVQPFTSYNNRFFLIIRNKSRINSKLILIQEL